MQHRTTTRHPHPHHHHHHPHNGCNGHGSTNGSLPLSTNGGTVPRKRRRKASSSSSTTATMVGRLLVWSLLVALAIWMILFNLSYYHDTHQQHHQQQQQHSTLSQVKRTNKLGQILHRQITKITASDLSDLDLSNTDTMENPSNMTLEQAKEGREELLALLLDAGVTDIDIPSLLRLPLWSTVTKLYGDGPVIYGLEHCEAFQKTVPSNDASIGPAGIFNTGTNLLAMYMAANCQMPNNPAKNRGMRWQVPWGKHMEASRKWTNTAKNDNKENKNHVLPVVLIRDPYSWMGSMCRHPYAAKWLHTKNHCPNLVPNEHDYKLYPFPGKNIPVRMSVNKNVTKWNSLAHLWTDWYDQYKVVQYPRLMVRFEDLIFHPRQLTEQICNCGGAVPAHEGQFMYVVDSAKWGPGHGGKRTSLISAMIKYGSETTRLAGFTPDDLQLAHDALDPELMKIFQYDMPLSSVQEEQ